MGRDGQVARESDAFNATRPVDGRNSERVRGQLCVGQSLPKSRVVALFFSSHKYVAATLLGVYILEDSRGCASGHSEGARYESMIAILIFGVSVLTLLQFFV